MGCHYLTAVLVITIFIATGNCGSRRHHDHDHQHVSPRRHDHDEHRDPHHPEPHQYFYAKIHRPSPFGQPHYAPWQDTGHEFYHGYGMHGHGHGHGGFEHNRGHFGHGLSRGDSSSDSSSDEDDDSHRCRRCRHKHQDHHHEESSEDQDDKKHEDQPDNRIWRFQIGDNFGAYEYLDNNEEVNGFHIDFMRAVCRRAGKRCYFLVDTYHNCWSTGGRELPGIGLLDHYYDGCIGNLPTPERLNSFNFTLPFSPNMMCGLLYKTGTERTSAEAHNVTGKKIGFVDGWAISSRCFERQAGYVGNVPGQYTPVLFETPKEMIRAMLHDEVDGVMTVDAFDSEKTRLQLVEPTFSCTLGGSSVMTMYGSEVLDWWNEAFLKMKADGSFRHLCERAIKEHGHKGRIVCLHD